MNDILYLNNNREYFNNTLDVFLEGITNLSYSHINKYYGQLNNSLVSAEVESIIKSHDISINNNIINIRSLFDNVISKSSINIKIKPNGDVLVEREFISNNDRENVKINYIFDDGILIESTYNDDKRVSLYRRSDSDRCIAKEMADEIEGIRSSICNNIGIKSR